MRRTVVVGWRLSVAILLTGAVCALAEPQPLFPNGLYTYTEPQRLINKTDFGQVAKEVQAIEATLGEHLNNVVVGCGFSIPIEGVTTADVLTEVFSAVHGIVLTAIGCHCTKNCLVTPTLAFFDRAGNRIDLQGGGDLACPGGTGDTVPVPTSVGDPDRTLNLGEGLRMTVVNTPTGDPGGAPAISLILLCAGS